MNFEDFEGFKRIKLKKDITLDEIYEILKRYQSETGEVKYVEYDDKLKIVVDVDGKYFIDVRIEDGELIIERKLETGHIEDDEKDEKSIALVHADRMIEQIYDLLKEYIHKGVITEHIVKAKKVLFAKQEKREIFGGALSIGSIFYIKDETGDILYEVKQNVINKNYSLFNVKNKREEAVINYADEKEFKFNILKHPFENIVITKDNTSSKTKFVAEFSTKELKISGDYTDNHYLLELNEIVIGSIDNTDPDVKHEYRIEICDLEHEYITLAFCIIADIYADLKQKQENKEI